MAGGPDVPLSLEIGLCVSLRSLPWYVQANPDCFFPRCYGLCTESEKREFLGEWLVAWPRRLALSVGPGNPAGPLSGPPSCRRAPRAGGGGGVMAGGPVPSQHLGPQLCFTW